MCPGGLAVGELGLERVATHNRNAATVTQGAGLPCKGSPAPSSHLVQGQAGRPGATQRRASKRGLPAPVGGARAWTW